MEKSSPRFYRGLENKEKEGCAVRNVYEGKEPYIFVSYAHKDADQVLRCIDALQKEGYRVWYDGGIEVGSEWPEYIGTHLAGCACVMAFISEHFVESMNCRQELALSQELRKEQLNIYLTRAELSMGLRLQLGLHQAVFRDKFSAEDAFLEALCSARMLEKCREVPEAPVEAPPAEKPVSPEEKPAAAQPQAQTPEEGPENAFEELEALVKSGKIVFAPEEPEKEEAADFVSPPPPKTPEQRAAQAAQDKECKKVAWQQVFLELSYGPISLYLMHVMTPWRKSSWWLLAIFFALRLCFALIHRARFQKQKKNIKKNALENTSLANGGISVMLCFLISTAVSLIGGIFTLQMPIFFLLRLLVAIGLNLLPFLVAGLITLTASD